ncbi:MAG: erythromycin esterase family protein [Bacteroidales bacterium]|jgi:erythromycin esterase-like protein|nr:erythromycin esterase family protein [Bacteroidales bacterium]MDD4672770.1 erythromycin esterase family protein [Bacteroidales bacterium]MDY0347788.1 erythromycin esterase family protein [Tenuifilaceae bacterium]
MKRFLGFLLLFGNLFSLAQNIEQKAIPLEGDASLDRLISAAAHKELVLLGEASHGTHEYYLWRDKISRRLIAEHGFSFIAVEGDFASLYHLNRYVKNLDGAASSAQEVLLRLERWPTWMWANEEVVALAEWLRNYNDKLPHDKKVGFYGMDVYDEWNSKKVVLDLLKTANQAAYTYVKNQYECFVPHKGDSWNYAYAVRAGKEDCAAATKNVVEYIRSNRTDFSELSDDTYFYLLQNAIVVHNAEEFYRESVASKGHVSWNSRAHHMHGTVNDLLNLYGENSKGIVWAHNTHIGDAEYSSMRNSGEKNIGQLSRKELGDDNVFLIGFTTYKGKVMAGSSWGAPMKKMTIPPAIRNSIEYKLNQIGLESFYLIFDENDRKEENLKAMGNRAVGVVYNPRRDERQFVPTIVPLRYDALFFFKKTTALRVLKR